jgi:uncharacterized protein YutE (UPF0331/DUF86 family)/predicted nucleotidyltransferase
VPRLTLDLAALACACRRQGIRLLVAFGSTVREMRHPDSDLDLALWAEAPNPSLAQLASIDAELRHLFAGEQVDLVLLPTASPLLQYQVAKHGEPLFEARPGLFRAFQALAAKRYADTAHLRVFDRVCVDRFLRRQAAMVDRDLVHRKLSLLTQYLGELEALRSLSYEDYLRQPLPRFAAERLLQLVVDTAVDINAHLAVELLNAPPQDYHDSFTKAAQVGALPAEFALMIAKSAGLRNRLVHQYDGVDHTIVYHAIAEAIAQYTEYCRYVTSFLDLHVPPPQV